jgi:hypothetical protein
MEPLLLSGFSFWIRRLGNAQRLVCYATLLSRVPHCAISGRRRSTQLEAHNNTSALMLPVTKSLSEGVSRWRAISGLLAVLTKMVRQL